MVGGDDVDVAIVVDVLDGHLQPCASGTAREIFESIPLLGISADFQPTITVEFNLNFGFGVDEDLGFYFDTSSPQELLLEITIDFGTTDGIPTSTGKGPDRAGADGRLLFLALKLLDGVDLDGDGFLDKDNFADNDPLTLIREREISTLFLTGGVIGNQNRNPVIA